jgi:hypothetical protein
MSAVRTPRSKIGVGNESRKVEAQSSLKINAQSTHALLRLECARPAGDQPINNENGKLIIGNANTHARTALILNNCAMLIKKLGRSN